MKNVTKKLSSVVVGLMVVGGVQADTFNATATVQSTITLVETTPFDMGTIFVTASDTTNDTNGTAATLTITTAGVFTPVDGVTATGEGVNAAGYVSKFVSLAPATPGVISVAGAAAFGTVTVTSGTPTALTHSSGSPSIPDIVFSTVVTLPVTTGTLTLDGAGAGDILVGGTFAAADSVNQYTDGVYTGTYDISVAY
ncbi:hypothetical protein A9Q81_19035 [Gammaproteobacteria bacterium 42_54_T18]|nr:hypothetical protein A9Q81_19035 [Gammaproteobacteria bacterium 42_54_T18]